MQCLKRQKRWLHSRKKGPVKFWRDGNRQKLLVLYLGFFFPWIKNELGAWQSYFFIWVIYFFCLSLNSYSSEVFSEVFNVGKNFAFKLCIFNTQFDGGTSFGGPSNFGFISFVFFLEALKSFLDLVGRPMWMIALYG